MWQIKKQHSFLPLNYLFLGNVKIFTYVSFKMGPITYFCYFVCFIYGGFCDGVHLGKSRNVYKVISDYSDLLAQWSKNGGKSAIIGTDKSLTSTKMHVLDLKIRLFELIKLDLYLNFNPLLCIYTYLFIFHEVVIEKPKKFEKMSIFFYGLKKILY